MTEEEYIRVSDLKSVRHALSILRDVIHPCVHDAITNALRSLTKAEGDLSNFDLDIREDGDTFGETE